MTPAFGRLRMPFPTSMIAWPKVSQSCPARKGTLVLSSAEVLITIGTPFIAMGRLTRVVERIGSPGPKQYFSSSASTFGAMLNSA